VERVVRVGGRSGESGGEKGGGREERVGAGREAGEGNSVRQAGAKQREGLPSNRRGLASSNCDRESVDDEPLERCCPFSDEIVQPSPNMKIRKSQFSQLKAPK
jgi:hypothetical protein